MSAAAKTPAPSGGASPHAPSILLPLRFMVTGVLALLTGMLGLVLRPDVLATYHYNQYVIALTHLFVLGWISTIVMGAMYQLVPVALETRLYSERLARWQFLLHLIGFSGMVWMFWRWDMKQVGHFGSVLGLGVVLFVYNIVRTLRRVPRWNVIATAVTSAVVWLSLAVLAGLTITAGKCSYEAAVAGPTPSGAVVKAVSTLATLPTHFDQISAMHAHAHLGALGVFVMLIVGISYKLVPMFTLSELQSERRARLSIWLLNVGLAGAFVTILLRSPWKLACTAVAVAGLVLYGLELRAILRARKRRTLDWGVKYFLTAVSLLGLLAVLAIVLSWPGLPLNAFTGQLENLYGFLALLGVVSLAIIGMLYKIVPFLVWYGAYSRRIGQGKVPSLADLYSAGWQAAGYWLYLAGLAGTSVALLLGHAPGVRLGCSLLVLSLLALALNVAKMLRHLVRPQFAASPRLATKATPAVPTLLPKPAKEML